LAAAPLSAKNSLRRKACEFVSERAGAPDMNYRDPRFFKTFVLLTFTVVAINEGMTLGKLDNGVGTSLTILVAILGAIVVVFLLFVLIRDIWKQDV
jgi:hypothetical protein